MPGHRTSDDTGRKDPPNNTNILYMEGILLHVACADGYSVCYGSRLRIRFSCQPTSILSGVHKFIFV